MKRNDKTAISLIVLVITILVLSILAATVIISLNNTNIMGQASETVFKQDMANYKETYEMYVTNKLAENATFDRSTLNITYEDEEFEEIFGSVPDKYKEGLKVVNGKLVYETEDETEKAVVKELNMKVQKLIGKEKETVTINGTEIERSKYIGYFADVDGDGTVDGVIFADLAHSASGNWFNEDGSFSYESVSGLKDYEIIEESYSVDGAAGYGSKPVLKATGSGEDRFYVMALSDITQSTNTTKNANRFTWYDAVYIYGISDDYLTVTSTNFGSGKANTVTMIENWNDEEYGAKNGNNSYLDMWGVIQDKVYGGKQQTLENVEWFVPSSAEWGAFGNAFGLTSNNESYGLSDYFWSSSLYGPYGAFYADFTYGAIEHDYVDGLDGYPCVRLATTF